MKLNVNVTGGMYTRMPMVRSEINIAMGVDGQCSESNHRPTVSSACVNPKKKRRKNAKVARSAVLKNSNNLGPPLLTGYGDTVIVSNPFDDAPYRATPLSTSNLTRMHQYRMIHPPIRGANSMMAQHPRSIQPTIVNPTRAVHLINNMTQNSFNGPFMNNRMRMGLIGNHEMRCPSMNSVMRNIPVKTQLNTNRFNFVNNMNVQAPLNGPVNNAPLYPNETSKFHPNQTSNDAENIPHLTNVNTCHSTHMGLRENSSIDTPGSHATSIGYTMNHSSSVPRSNRQETLDMFIQQSGEKIYPVGQPMIFDSQNPHAPPIYPCGICHKEVNGNDQGIICESGCNFWFHRVCLGLSEAAFQLLTREVYAEWVCDNCLRSKNVPVVKFKP